jgi:phage gp45-like
MHRATHAHSSIRGYVAGGCRAVLPEVDDKPNMQETKGARGWKGHKWPNFEAPQNYGNTSVIHDSDQKQQQQSGGGGGGSGGGDQSKPGNSSEAFIMFPGGNASFAVIAGGTDDRRHRTKDLGKGDNMTHRGAEDGLQFHMHDKGTSISTGSERTMRMAVVPQPSKKKKQTAGPQASATAASGGGGGGSGGGDQGGGKPEGQKSLREDNDKSKKYFQQTDKSQKHQHDELYSMVNSEDSSNFHQDKTKSSQATEDHVHMRYKEFKIWVDKYGHWSEAPIMQKKDVFCKTDMS